MRWIFIIAAIAGFALAFSTRSAGVLAIGLVVGIVGAIGSILQVIDGRMSANSRNDATMMTDRDVVNLRAAAVQARAEKLKRLQALNQANDEKVDRIAPKP